MSTMTTTPALHTARKFDQLDQAVKAAAPEALAAFLRTCRARFAKTPTTSLGYVIEVVRAEQRHRRDGR